MGVKSKMQGNIAVAMSDIFTDMGKGFLEKHTLQDIQDNIQTLAASVTMLRYHTTEDEFLERFRIALGDAQH